MHVSRLLFFVIITIGWCSVTTTTTILFIPLDERFTTRSIVLNLARLIQDDFILLTPPLDLLSQWKQPANTSGLFQWIHDQIIDSCSLSRSCSLLISSEQLLYGGLINSRLSNTSSDELHSRLNAFIDFKRTFGLAVKFYLSAVIMRIPAYNDDFEEPHYWAIYGRLIYLWSFYTDRYAVLHNPADEEQVRILQSQIPTDVLNEFVWRRQRNFNLTYNLLRDYTAPYFERIWLTLDDNAEFGLNKAEERQLVQLINDPRINISTKVNVYAGADEVGLAMLSQIVVDNYPQHSSPPTFAVHYRNVTTQNRIPNYEGAPLNESILKQIAAVGGQYSNASNQTSPDVLVLINNWSTDTQYEAPLDQTCEDYSTLNITTKNSIVVYADVRYSNGGDRCFSQWMLNRTEFGTYAYAGWNTNGNTLGTCLSNGLLLALYLNSKTKNNNQQITTMKENRRFTLYRLVEDIQYQANVRQKLADYLTNVSLDQINFDLNFYELFVNKGFKQYANKISNEFIVNNVYFPWNRTFEIGFQLLNY